MSARILSDGRVMSNVESLARLAGPVECRGYVWRHGVWVEFAVGGGWAWVDDGDDGVRRETYDPQAFRESYLTPITEPRR